MPRTNSKPKSLFSDELLDELIAGKSTQADVGELIKDFGKALIERMLKAELTHHLGHEHGQNVVSESSNERNGYSKKTLKSEQGEVEISVPRDREGSFEPLIVRKHQSRVAGLDDKIIALYARGMSNRDIQSQLLEMYGVEISAGLISEVTEAVMDEVKVWQSRPLEDVYPIVYLDCIHLKIRKDGLVSSRAVYVVLGVNWEGVKQVLGIWTSATEGAKFWMSVLSDLKARGVKDIFIACVDGLKGFPEAIEAIFPSTQVQLCIVHQVRNSLKFVGYKERKAVAVDLKAIYGAATLGEAELALTAFRQRYDQKYPTIGLSWARNWSYLTTFFDYPPEIRKVIYTTNAVESVHSQLRRVTRNKAAFPSEEAALKLLYLAIKRATLKWSMPIRDWHSALNLFAILFEGRAPL